jgi:hypothetical protein
MADLSVTDEATDQTAQLVRNLADEAALSPAIRRYSAAQTGSFEVASTITESQELRHRVTDAVRERITELAGSVDTAAAVLADTDSTLSGDLP